MWRGPAAICLSPHTSGSRAILRDLRRTAFDLYVSEPVLEESAAGDATFARKRIESLADVPVLALTSGIIGLAEALVAEGPIPRKAAGDALSYRCCDGVWLRVPAHLELPAYCQCRDPASSPSGGED